jgi:type II secretory pathway component GspD/PulD (secretin)
MMQKQSGSRALLCLSLTILLLGQGLPAAIAANPDVLTGDVRVTVSPANIHETLPVAGAVRTVTMALHGVSIEDALKALAKKGGFNVLIDESVSGTVNVDWNNIRIQDALENLKTYANLAYDVKGNNLIVATADSDKGKSFNKNSTRIIPLRNANAKVVADLLNTTLFSDRAAAAGTSGGANNLPVTADYHTNSLVVVGSPTDIKVVQEHVDALDRPREMKTWRLSQANVLDVATILSSSLFNEGQAAIVTSGGSGGSSSSGSGTGAGSVTASPMRVTAENIQDGQGTSQASQTGGSSGGSSGQTSLTGSMTLRAKVKTSQTLQINPTGAIIIPDTRLNTLTLLGTAEQIAMAEALIPTLDRKVPQVILEASLIELSEEARKDLGYSTAGNRGFFASGTNNNPTATTIVNQIWSNSIGMAANTSNPLESVYRFVTSPQTRRSNFAIQLNALISKNKAKMLANPNVITTSDNETIISIVDEIIRSVTVTQGFGLPPTATTNIGEAGIVLNMLPRVGADNTVSLRIRPTISTVAGQQTDRFGNVVTLLSKREVLAQNIVLHDGETFVLGGLVHNTNTSTVSRDPVLSRMPIVGALARNTGTTKNKTELVVMITPHIINDESQVARLKMQNPTGQPGAQIVPATLSKVEPDSAELGMVPVSLSGAARSSAIPPLDKVHVITNTASLGSTSVERHLTSPKGSLQVRDLMPAPGMPNGFGNRESAKRIEPMASVGARTGPQPSDISDETIRSIMEKFK